MNSSWKVFRALSAASQMGMSLWRMYSAKEQDQPPSVLLVGTFYENQQETGPGEGGSMPRITQATPVPWKGEPSHVHPRFPWRMFCFQEQQHFLSFLLQPLYHSVT